MVVTSGPSLGRSTTSVAARRPGRPNRDRALYNESVRDGRAGVAVRVAKRRDECLPAAACPPACCLPAPPPAVPLTAPARLRRCMLASRRISDDVAGFTALTRLLAEYAGGETFTPVDVALETDRGLLVAALRAAGHRVWAINPKAVDRYRDRHAVSGAKSDPGDALVLAHLLRTDAERHRPMPEDSEQVAAVAVLARAHQDAVWTQLRDAGRLRSLLREFFPAALAAFPNLAIRTAITVLAAAPTPAGACLDAARPPPEHTRRVGEASSLRGTVLLRLSTALGVLLTYRGKMNLSSDTPDRLLTRGRVWVNVG